MKLLARDKPLKGLVPTSHALELSLKWAMDEIRIKSVLSSLSPPGLRSLTLVYLSGRRGINESEIISSGDKQNREDLLFELSRLLFEQFIYSRNGEQKSYHGFLEYTSILLEPCLFQQLQSRGSAQASDTDVYIGYQFYLASHLSLIVSQAALAMLKLTQTGEMHRKSFSTITEKFQFIRNLSDSAAEHELWFLLNFCADKKILLREENLYQPGSLTSRYLQGSAATFSNELVKWWLDYRWPSDKNTLQILLKSLESPCQSALICDLLWFPEGPRHRAFEKASSGVTWDSLPRLVRELWMLGLIDFQIGKGKIQWIKANSKWTAFLNANELDSSSEPNKALALPTLECLVPLECPMEWRYTLDLVAQRENDEMMCKYRFSKDSVVAGLQAGLAMESWNQLNDWLAWDLSARHSLDDWAASYASTVFKDVTLLHVKDQQRRDELFHLPAFMELVEEYIPTYGFVLRHGAKILVKTLLQGFGLSPAESRSYKPQLEPIKLNPDKANWDFEGLSEGELEYYEKELPPSPRPKNVNQGKYGGEKKDLSPGEKRQIIEYAMMSEKKIEITFLEGDKKAYLIKPLFLLSDREQPMMVATQMETGHRNEYDINKIGTLTIIE